MPRNLRQFQTIEMQCSVQGHTCVKTKVAYASKKGTNPAQGRPLGMGACFLNDCSISEPDYFTRVLWREHMRVNYPEAWGELEKCERTKNDDEDSEPETCP